MQLIHITEQANYKPGDQAPDGYLAWHEWADVQHRAGLRQRQCGRCGLWRYPQQFSTLIDEIELTRVSIRKVEKTIQKFPVCNKCAEKEAVNA